VGCHEFYVFIAVSEQNSRQIYRWEKLKIKEKKLHEEMDKNNWSNWVHVYG